MNIQAVRKAVGMMSLLEFFPSDEDSRGALMELLGEMCSTDEQVLWLARRMRNLYRKWPGAQEMRAAFCSKFTPRDGIEAYSSAYPDGIPSEKEQRGLIAGPEQRQISEGRDV